MSSAFQAFVPSRLRWNPKIESFPSLLRPWHVSSSTFRKLEFLGILFSVFLLVFRVISHRFRRSARESTSIPVEPRRDLRGLSLGQPAPRKSPKQIGPRLPIEPTIEESRYLGLLVFLVPSYARDRAMLIYAIERVKYEFRRSSERT